MGNNKFFRIKFKQETMLANLLEAAQARIAHGIEVHRQGFFKHFEKVTDVVPSNSIAITQVSGQANFVLMPTGTYADPDPIKTANTEKFNVAGIWNIDASSLDHVEFTCKLQGVEVFKQDFKCATGDANCPLPLAPSASSGRVCSPSMSQASLPHSSMTSTLKLTRPTRPNSSTSNLSSASEH